MQREQLDDAWSCFYECLRIRRHVYAYAASAEDANPIHTEVSCVLHELGTCGFAQKQYSLSMEMLNAEKTVLEKLEETSQSERTYQALFTNLTWSIKCAKEMGDNAKAALLSNEKIAMKRNIEMQTSSEKCCRHLHVHSDALQKKAMHCRLLARKFALENPTMYPDDLSSSLEALWEEIKRTPSGKMKQASMQFRDTILMWIDKPKRRTPILTACDNLR